MQQRFRPVQWVLEHRRTFKKARLSHSIGGGIALRIFLLAVCAFMIFPIAYSVIQSFKPMDEIFMYPPRFFVRNPGLDNFRSVFSLAGNLWVPFSRYVFNSVFVTVAGTALYVLIASMAAFPLAKAKFPGVLIISQLVVWTLLFRTEVTAIPTYIIVAGLGMVDTYLALILPMLASTMGVFLMKQFIVASVPDSTLEAARIDGTGEYRICFSIVMPSVKPAWLTLIIFTFQSIWNSTGTQQYVFSEELKQLPAVLTSIATGGIARSGAAAAGSVLLMVPPIVIFLFAQSSVMETMTHSGMK
jgi:ABC-type glycerol-3-phosphate transport system permease component